MGRTFSDRVETGEWMAPAAELVGFRSVSFGEGKAVFEMDAEERHHNPIGTALGGILCTLADSAMGFAFASAIARISHRASAAAADTGMSAADRRIPPAVRPIHPASRSVGLLDALSKCASGALGRATCIHARLHRLAPSGGYLPTNPDEKCGLGPGESFTTLELKMNSLRPVLAGRLVAAARVVHRGKMVGLVECDVENADRKLVARATSTCQVLRGEAARGR